MKWFSRLVSSKQTTTAEVQETKQAVVHEIVPQVTLADIPALVVPPTHVILKRLKWVKRDGRIAIVYELDTSGFAVIHYVDRTTGETVGIDRVRCSELTLARFEDIPEVRRKNLSPAVAAVLGYM